MAIASFLNTGFAFTALAGVTDVTSIANAIITMLTSTLGAAATNVYPSGERWSSSGSGPWTLTAPTDNGGRFMTIIMTRNSATQLEWQISDPTGQLLDGTIQIAGGGSTVNIYGGPGYLLIEANNAGTWETMAAIMTDPTPEPLAASTVFVWCRAHRNNAGTGLANAANADFWGGRYWGGTITSTVFVTWLGRPHNPIQDNSNTHLRTQAGSDCAAPAYIVIDSSANQDNFLNAGKLYQVALPDSNQVAGVDLTIPIDTGVTGTFRVLHLGPIGCCQFAMRKG